MLTYIGLSVLWTRNPEASTEAYYDTLRYFLMIGVFLTITLYLAQKKGDLLEKTIFWASLAASISAVISILVFYRSHPFPGTRLEGIFWNDYLSYCIMPAVYYGFLGIGTIYRAQYEDIYWKKIYFCSISLVIIAFILLTQSRGPFLALVIALLTGFILDKRWKLIGTILLVGLGWLALAEFGDTGIRGFISTGIPDRFAIWEVTLEQIRESPWFGKGYLTNIQIFANDQFWGHPHSMFLSLILKTGILGGLLFLLLIAVFFIDAFRYYKEYGDWQYIAMLLFILIATNSHKMRLFYKPAMSWLVFWLPITIMAVKVEKTRNG
ncbi:MAG: O-antigen ligase family protein [Desulfobacterales bacterium]|nr:O-antigen ligase family protein [Desulfobacterales bacterium]